MKYKNKERLKDLLWCVLFGIGSYILYIKGEVLASHMLMLIVGMIFNRQIEEKENSNAK
jgi:TctA family transporter